MKRRSPVALSPLLLPGHFWDGSLIYIQDVRAKIEKLAPAWGKGTLSQEELRELYSLFDEVVREARRTRSCSVDNAHSPENYLLVVFENRIKSTVFKFLGEKIKMGIELEEAGGKKPLYETSTFKEWMHYGRQLTLTIILGDATERQDRRKAVEPFLRKFESSEEKHLTLNYKWIKASLDAHLGVTGTHKKHGFLSDLMRPEALKKAEIELKKFSEKKRGPFLDGFIGPGFIIKDASAIEAAIRLARQKGIGYDPDDKRKKLKDLTFKKALAMKALRAWQRGENHHEFRTEKEVTEWIKNRLVPCNIYMLGYNRLNLIRASGVVNCQSMVLKELFRSFSQIATSVCMVVISAIRRSRHCPFKALSSISAMLSQLPCFGV